MTEDDEIKRSLRAWGGAPFDGGLTGADVERIVRRILAEEADARQPKYRAGSELFYTQEAANRYRYWIDRMGGSACCG